MKRYLLLLLVVSVCNQFVFSQCSGKTLQFDGVNDYVIVPDNPSINFTTQFTAELWVKTTTFSNTVIIEKSNNNTNYGFQTFNGNILFFISSISTASYIQSSITINDNNWHHLAGTFDDAANTLKLYIDGVLNTTNTNATNSIVANNQPFLIGSRSGAASFPGQLDELRLWNTVLNGTTIQQWKNKTVTASHPNYANLAAYWKFDENAGFTTSDASANGNTGTLTNSPLWISSQAPVCSQPQSITCAGNAIQFDGVNDYIETNNASLTSSSNGTIEAWVNTSALGGDQALISRSKTTGTIGIWLVIRSNGMVDFNQNDNFFAWHTASSTTLLVAGQWNHIAATWGSGGMKLYINGILEGSDSYTGVGTPASYTTVFGDWKEQISGPYSFRGKMDEVRIWNTALSQTNIQQWKNITLTSLHPNYVNLAGYWGFNEGVDLVTVDASGNNNHGVLSNGPVWVSPGAISNDIIAPVPPVSTLPTITGQCSATVTAPTATDNCAGTITATTTDPTSYNTQGTYTVHWTYDDGNGNTSTQNQTVIVDDDIAPVPNVAILSTETGQCSATVTAPTATDNCAGTITATTSDPTSYNAEGTYTVHWTYDDGNGNTSTQNQTVIVNDITAPNFTSCSANISLSACISTATWTEPTASDNCNGVSVVRTAGPPPGSSFSNGTTTTITYTATDAVGNQTTCSFTVTRAAALSASSSATTILCNGGSSTVNVNVTGGTAPYTGTGTFIRSAGAYSFTVTDANGCTANTSVTITQPEALVATCSSNNYVLYFGYTGDQTATIKATPSGGVAPYTVSFTMNRPLNCNVITSSGDEVWTGASGTTINNTCPSSGPGLIPVSTGVVMAGGFYSVNVTLMQDAQITATITDANGCVVICTTNIDAEDVRCFAGSSGLSKVTLCHRTSSTKNPCVTICVDESAVADHIAHGDFMGKCTPNCVAPIVNTGSTSMNIIAEVAQSKDGLRVKIWPVPTENFFTLQAQSASNAEITVRVIDISGKQLYINKGPASKSYRFGETFVAGMYIVEVRQGNRLSVTKVIKQ